MDPMHTNTDKTAKGKQYLIKYALICAVVDAVLSVLIATLNATVLGAGGTAIGASGTATTVAAVITWILTAFFSFFVIGFFMLIISAMAAFILVFVFGGKKDKTDGPSTTPDGLPEAGTEAGKTDEKA